jgi:ABC-type phosphate/phosphonate transport system permease subunit
MSTPETAVSKSTKKPARRGAQTFWLIMLIALLILAGWAYLSINWSYSDGERAGVLQKFSRKGWVCKTYEGELAQYVAAGLAPQIWAFTVRDAVVATKLSDLVGQKVQLHYAEHRGIPTNCFGETGYFVESVRLVPP